MADEETDRPTDRQTYRLEDGLTGRQMRRPDKHAGLQVERQGGRETVCQLDTVIDRLRDGRWQQVGNHSVNHSGNTLAVALTFMWTVTPAYAHAHGHAHIQSTTQSTIQSTTE